jgi:hypothetical protein
MPGVTYDTGALIAAERNDRRMWALHAGFLAEEIVPTVPAPVLAEAWRGGSRQASLAGFLALCTIEPLTEQQAKAVGALAGRADHDEHRRRDRRRRRRSPPRRHRYLQRHPHHTDRQRSPRPTHDRTHLSGRQRSRSPAMELLAKALGAFSIVPSR